MHAREAAGEVAVEHQPKQLISRRCKEAWKRENWSRDWIQEWANENGRKIWRTSKWPERRRAQLRERSLCRLQPTWKVDTQSQQHSAKQEPRHPWISSSPEPHAWFYAIPTKHGQNRRRSNLRGPKPCHRSASRTHSPWRPNHKPNHQTPSRPKAPNRHPNFWKYQIKQ